MATRTKSGYGALAKRLDDELREAREHLEQIDRDTVALARDDAQEGGVPANHMADEGSDVYERERLYTVREELRARLEQIESAQQRIAAGTYGTCERCGKSIPRARLEALPYATLCVDCQAELEEADPGNKPRLPLT